MEDLEFVNQDIKILDLICKLLSKHSNKLSYDELKVYKGEMVKTCIDIITELDADRVKNIQETIKKYNEIVKSLVEENNKLTESSCRCIDDIINNTVDDDIKIKGLEWIVNTYKEIKEFNKKYNNEIKKLEQND